MQAAPGAALNDAVPPSAGEGRPDVPSSGARTEAGEPARSNRYLWVVLGVALAVVLVDRVTKLIALDRLADGRVVPIVDPWFQLRLVFNPGAAFGLAGGYTVLITLVAIAVVVVIVRVSRRLHNVWWAVALGGILGGALGNLVDRMTRDPGPFRGYVIDFFEWPGFPVFNLADVAIVTSVALIFLLSLLGVAYDAPGPEEPPDPRLEDRHR